MNQRITTAPPELFRSPLPGIAAVFYTIGALCGIGAAAALFLPDSLTVLTEDLIRGGVTDASSIRTWTVIHIILILSGLLCSLGMAIGLILELRQKGRGLDLLHTLSQVLMWALKIGGWAVLGVMIYRAARYLWACLWVDEGIYLAYIMLVPEGVMVALSVGAYTLFRRFVDGVVDGTASMAYTRVCGKLDSFTIPGICSTGFVVTALTNVYFALERLTTVTIIEDYDGDYYSLLIAQHPVLVYTAVMFACGIIANLLIGLYLKRYKRDAERLVFRSMRSTLEK